MRCAHERCVRARGQRWCVRARVLCMCVLCMCVCVEDEMSHLLLIARHHHLDAAPRVLLLAQLLLHLARLELELSVPRVALANRCFELLVPLLQLLSELKEKSRDAPESKHTEVPGSVHGWREEGEREREHAIERGGGGVCVSVCAVLVQHRVWM